MRLKKLLLMQKEHMPELKKNINIGNEFISIISHFLMVKK